jgi:hypothetical protein
MLSKIKLQVGNFIYEYSKLQNKKYSKELSLKAVRHAFPTRNLQYKYFHHYFWNLAPAWLRDHRKYFSQENRGFGEDAFHAMWYFIFKEFHPKNILEIGVYRGQTISLFSLLGKNLKLNTDVQGISPFTSAGDAVSSYSDEPDYYHDVIANFNYFNLPLPTLHKGFSTDEAMLPVIRSRAWDLIYIDGNHDYEVANYDFKVSAENLAVGGLIVLDDAALYTDFIPPVYATAGHPGPSKLAAEIEPALFSEIFSAGHNRVFKKL